MNGKSCDTGKGETLFQCRSNEIADCFPMNRVDENNTSELVFSMTSINSGSYVYRLKNPSTKNVINQMIQLSLPMLKIKK